MMNYLFQIADFGLSKKLAADTEYYVTSGGLVPLKWTAPEVSVLYMHTIMLCLNPSNVIALIVPLTGHFLQEVQHKQ